MQHPIESARSDAGDLVSLGMQPQFEPTLGGIAYQSDAPLWEPSTDEADQLMRPQRDGLVSLAQPFADFRGGCQPTQKGPRPALLGPGHADDDRHDDPAQTRAARPCLLCWKAHEHGHGLVC